MEDEVVQSQVLVGDCRCHWGHRGVFKDGQRHDRTDHDAGHVVCYFDCLYSRGGVYRRQEGRGRRICRGSERVRGRGPSGPPFLKTCQLDSYQI